MNYHFVSYDLQWFTTYNQLQLSFHCLGFVTHNNLWYVVGGVSSSRNWLLSSEVYDPKTKVWLSLPDFSTSQRVSPHLCIAQIPVPQQTS